MDQPSIKTSGLSKDQVLAYNYAKAIQSGGKNFSFLVELSRSPVMSELIAQRVLQDNSHWSHSENIFISLPADDAEERIMTARKEHNHDLHPRHFIPPKVIFEELF